MKEGEISFVSLHSETMCCTYWSVKLEGKVLFH